MDEEKEPEILTFTTNCASFEGNLEELQDFADYVQSVNGCARCFQEKLEKEDN